MRVRADLKGFAIKLLEAGAQGGLLWGGDSSALSGLIQAISGAAETVHIKREVDELAWELVRNALIRAMAALYDEGAASREPARGDLQHLTARVEIELDEPATEIPHTLFKNPSSIPLVATVRGRFASWLRLVDLNEAEAASLANRLPNYLALAFHEEWRSRRDHYQPLFDHHEGPLTAAAQMAWDWERNRLALSRQLDEPVFEETFSLRQVYMPLRAYWREDLKDRKARPEERKHRLRVVDLDEAIEDWLNSAEHGDAIRLVSGGPGSGKSSFAKKLAADLAETSRMRALFFPLQRFPTRMPLPQAIETWLLGSGAFAESPIRQPEFASSTSRLLLIFDGLDELTKPGDLADEMTREFVQQVCTHVGIWNASERRVLVLVTGRTIVAEHYRQRLGVQEKQRLAVLPYLLENVDKDELARRQQAEIDDPLSRLEVDQRPIWWDKYTQAKGHPGVPLPEIFEESPDIKELTKEPLLNYLVIFSKFHEQSAEESPKNRNEIYAMLLRDVLNRRHAKRNPKEPDPVLAGLDDVSDRETFERLLETIATAAWYGDGRTTTLKEARALCPSGLVGKFDELAKEKGGFVRLLAAVYFQESRDRRDEDDAFEFTHKSFGEYLTARRLVREVRQVDKGLREYPDFFSEDRALEAWCRLTGPQAMSMDLFRFLRDEVALRDRDEVVRWQDTLTRLFNRNLRNGPPLEIYKEDQTFRLMERKARNAEEALLAVLNACALAREEAALDVIPVDWPDANSGGEMLHRLRGQRDPNLPVVVLDCLASLDLSGQILTCQELVWADLRGADLGGSDLRASRFLEADVRGAHLADSDLEDADLRYADLSMANLTEANLLGADLRGARLYAAILIASDLSQAQLLAADLSGADLSAALLINADLSSANLNEADLVAADLSGARLFETDLSDADLSDADLSGADLSAARGLTQNQLDEAWGDERTKLLEGLTIRSRPA